MVSEELKQGQSRGGNKGGPGGSCLVVFGEKEELWVSQPLRLPGSHPREPVSQVSPLPPAPTQTVAACLHLPSLVV